MAVSTMIGAKIHRREDPRMVQGQGRYTDDFVRPGTTYLAMVRSPYAHARIKAVDVAEARKIPGVLAALSGEDLASEWAGPLPCVWPVTEDIKMPPHWPVAKDKVRYMGDAVAVVVATSRQLAIDAAEAVQVDYEPLPAVTDVEAALAEFESSLFRPAAKTLAIVVGEVPDDGPSLVLLSRAVNALVHGPEEKHPVWDLPGQ